MESRNVLKFFTLIFLASIFFGCKKSDERFEKKLLVNTDYIEVSSKSNSYSFEILSNQAIELSTDADWITFDTTALEKGKHTISFTTKKNEDEERSGTISVKISEDLTKDILVIQEAGLINIFYVKSGATGNGRSWDQASDLMTALDNSTSGSIIHIAEGTYIPSKTITNGESSNAGDKTFEISKNISLIGGYPANATTGTSPNPQLYKTVFSGKQSDGSESFHVVTISAPVATGEKVSIEGITVKEGNATDRGINITINGNQFSRGMGGGMLIRGSTVLLKDVNIIENVASAKSGTAGFCAGLYVFGNANLEMQNCKVNDNNNSVGNSGGLWVYESKAYIYNSQVNNNYAKGTAGGVHSYPDSEVFMYNSEVKNNKNTSFGAGVYARQNSKIAMINCLVTDNVTTSANGGGGVMLYDNCVADIISCTISNNGTPGPGGGIYRRQNSNSLTLINTIVAGNAQSGSSKDVDSYVAAAGPLVIKSSVLASKAYDGTGSEITTAFNPISMLDANYKPIGSDNPALQYGMGASQLDLISQSYNPVLSSEILKDFNGVSREGKTIMGAFVN
ncbi:MAG TPA: right-handed parallel beta-helix repeat-containing protein [Pelobium sp.]|nr:right-handed parallel beta-helix repeat-containing protein [Pelobium sp.]